MSGRGNRLARLHLIRTIRVREAGGQLSAAVAAAAVQAVMRQRIDELRGALAAEQGVTHGEALNAQAALRAALLLAAQRQVARQGDASEKLAAAQLNVQQKRQSADAVERAIGRERLAAAAASATGVSMPAKARRL